MSSTTAHTPAPDPDLTATDGTVTGAPRRWLRLEALTILSGSLIAFTTTNESWWLVPAVLFLPDLLMAGYLYSTRLGALAYNLVHATPIPAVGIAIGWWQHSPLLLAIGLVWLAHIGLDRALGYGLKYPDHFQHTHLGHIGRP